MYRLEEYQYNLPAELIAQAPAKKRDEARLMILKRASSRIEHRNILDLEQYLSANDLLVVNNTRVVPARLIGQKKSGGRVEALVLHPTTEQGSYRCLIKASKPPKTGTILRFADGVEARVSEPVIAGKTRLEFLGNRPLLEVLENVGTVPLPPYIRSNGSQVAVDHTRAYQTVYAEKSGAIAAPTAGLHFSENLLEKLANKGVTLVSLTLHVGHGTFQPVREVDIRKHRLNQEYYEISTETALTVNRAKESGMRVVAVGTTAVRALEFAACSHGVQSGRGWCDLLIYPGFRFQVVDALLTNFHLPGSSLIMLVSAWAGRSLLLSAYSEAIRKQYRFYSYGDAMLIE